MPCWVSCVFGGHWAVRQCGATQGTRGERAERDMERGACHGERVSEGLRWAEVSVRWLSFLSVVQGLFINPHPWVHQTEAEGGSEDGGEDGRRALALVTTRDLLPFCLPVCLNADLVIHYRQGTTFLTKYKHKQEHMHNKTHTWKNTHALKPAKGNRGVTKDRQCPLVFSLKRNQTKSANHHPKQSHKNRYRRGAWKTDKGWGARGDEAGFMGEVALHGKGTWVVAAEKGGGSITVRGIERARDGS